MSRARQEYAEGLARHEAAIALLERRATRLGYARLLVFLLVVALMWPVVVAARISPWALLAPAAGFVVLVVAHARARAAIRRATRAAAFHARGLARLEDRWTGQGRPGDAYQEGDHPFAADLDCFGRGSLFERLCEARTAAGERVLANWLQHPAAPETVRLRQAAVRELRDRTSLREAMAVLGDDVRERFDERPLVAWARRPQPEFPAATRLVCRLLVAMLLTGIAGAWAGLWTGAVVLLPLGLIGAWGFALRPRVRATIADVDAAARELDDLAGMIALLEREPVDSPLLRDLRGRLAAVGRPASAQICRLRRLLALLDTRGNQLVMLVLPLLLWTTQVAWAVGRWRREVGPLTEDWVAAMGEYEALASLAGYAFEHPDDAWPELVPGAGLVVENLGHPLLAGGGRRNSLRLGEAPQMLVVSGSNMSGKSTLLRAVGTAVVMAQAGGPVRATRMVLEPLAVGASIATHDSLQDGRSRFYAEITRLRQVMDLTEGGDRVLFLLDELLSGTNSHDRRIGAEAVVRSLVGRGALGLLTTHDLALAQVAESLAPRAANVHFEDSVVGGEIQFDYRLREGVVTRSNALALMRSIGLEI